MGEVYRRYFPDGTVERVEWYDQDRPVGEQVEYYAGGRRKSVRRYDDGVARGVAEYWNPDGTLIVRETWAGGELHGPFQRWHPNGHLQAEGQHDGGVARGTWTWFLDDGTVWHQADPEPCEQAERRLGAELYAELGRGAVYVRIEPGTWTVTGWYPAWRGYPVVGPEPAYSTPLWRDPAEIDAACVPSPTPSSRWREQGLDAATLAAIDRAVSMTAVPGGIMLGGYFDEWEIVRDGDAYVAIVRGKWLE